MLDLGAFRRRRIGESASPRRQFAIGRGRGEPKRSLPPPLRAGDGTSSSPVTTISAARPWSVPKCATPSTAVYGRDGWPLAMLGFSTAARKLAPRDHFIGWTPKLRAKNLPLVIDNPRFLILPWITIPNLGSHILSLVRRQLPDDWTERYNITPVLIETFVETPRFTGVLYKASG